MMPGNYGYNVNEICRQLSALRVDVGAGFFGLTADGNVVSAPESQGISDGDCEKMRAFLELPADKPRDIKKAEVEAFLDKSRGKTAGVGEHQQIASTRHGKLKLIEGDVCELLKDNPSQCQQTLIMPCNVQNDHGVGIHWQYRTGAVLKAITTFWSSLKTGVDLYSLLNEQEIPREKILSSVVSVELPENSVNLRHLIIFPLSEFTSTKETLDTQYKAAQKVISEECLPGSQLLLIPPAVSKQYNSVINQLVMPAYKSCAENVGHLSSGNDVTIICFSGSQDKVRLEKEGLKDGQELAHNDEGHETSSLHARWEMDECVIS